MTKKAALVTPYGDTLGGGERYLLTLGQVLLDAGWQVEATLKNNSLLEKSRQRFNLPLVSLKLKPFDYFSTNFFKKLIIHPHYDLIFWVSDGSIPTILAKKNWLHFQVPFHNLGQMSLLNRIKLSLINNVIYNSHFTKNIIKKNYPVKNSQVWYPPVAVDEFSPGEKENIIVAVGRFEVTMNVKRQDVLIKTFKKLVDGGLKGWRFILIGGSHQPEEKNKFLQKLKKRASGYPIEFKVNAPFSQLQEAYNKAKIFWHAAGYGFDEEKEPEKMEHFGMTTIEALAAGCWPLVYKAGGQKEIFTDVSWQNKSLWETPEELMAKTKKVIMKKEIEQKHLLKLAQRYSIENFKKHIAQCL